VGALDKVGTRQVLQLGLSVSLGVITWMGLVRRRRLGCSLLDERGLCTWLLVALLVSPVSEPHHLVLALPGKAVREASGKPVRSSTKSPEQTGLCRLRRESGHAEGWWLRARPG
jgi:hypothetical protein